MEKKILITGASGLLGRQLLKSFNESSWETLGLAHSRVANSLLRCDLANKEEVIRIISQFQPAAILHSAAQRYPDKVEKEYDQSVQLNVEVTRNLAEISAKGGIHLLYISTDYVFDGTKPPYSETDATNPINKYGKTKADGEVAVIDSNPDASILRVPVLYGDEEYLGEGAISVLLKAILNKTPQGVSDYEKRYPSHTSDIANICLQLMEKRANDPRIKGIYQWCGGEMLTKFDMVKIMSEQFNLPISHITPASGSSGDATRPYDTQMSTNRLSELGIGHHTPFQTGIRSFEKFLL